MSHGQTVSNWRSKTIEVNSDIILVDSLSIVPSTFLVKDANGNFLPKEDYNLNFSEAKLILDKKYIGQTIGIEYRLFPISFAAPYAHKTIDQLEPNDPGLYNYYTLKKEAPKTDPFGVSGLNKNGSVSRGVNFGNSQNLSVNSNLDLQLSGRITDEINIQAAISDNNIPIQADGNTLQLQEFDRVFMRLYNDKSSLIAGDFLISRPNSYFMNFNKKVQGGGFSTEFVTHQAKGEEERGLLKSAVNGAISRGKFARNIVPGIEGNQGPYRLQGNEGESFIIILSGTERVYVNGRLKTRGQDYDYIIDYNTAELTFTPNQIINKDLRIVVEFQYADQNYARSVFFIENEYKKKDLELNFNVYSEQDSKNQPLQQELTDTEKRVLTDAGDDLDNAIISGIDTTGFDNDQVRYKLIDTLGFQNVLVFSKNPDEAIYAARFSLVGEGNGNYRQIQSDANGRVFEFIPPINGQPQGRFEPIIRLISPKKRQMISLGGKYKWGEHTSVNFEGAMTNNDLNTFSTADSKDNQSYGFLIELKNDRLLGEKQTTKWQNQLFYEQRGRDFQFIERYRRVEFDRDWNIRGLNLSGNEYLIQAKSGLKSKQNFINYEFGSFTKGVDYTGIKNGYSANYEHQGFQAESRGSYLSVDALNNSEFVRHYTTISQKVKGFKVGGYLEQERILFYQGKSDTLQGNSFDRVIWNAFIERGDSTSANNYRLSYGEVYDYFPSSEKLGFAVKSENFDFEFGIGANPKSRLSAKLTYRSLTIQNNELTNRDPENTLLGRVQYDLKAMKGFLTANTYYQLGSGFENKREFLFLQVNDGQGTHLWIDFNGNGLKELNEFEVAGVNNAFQANYIRVLTPTNEFVRVFSNQFNQVFFLRPNAILNDAKGWKKVVGLFSNKSAYRAERETQKEKDSFNPFQTNVADTFLISINSSFSNTLYFNRLGQKFGMEFFYLNNNSKSLLTNGFESRSIVQRELRSRYNLNKVYALEASYIVSERGTRSEFFSNRNFTIQSNEIEPKFIYQPSVSFRISCSGNYAERQNKLGTEQSISRSATTELRFNDAGKGTFSVKASIINIQFNAAENNSLAFEMLDGLTAGANTTWEVFWQRTLAKNLQLNLNYNGRKSEGLQTIHAGGMQIRAFF